MSDTDWWAKQLQQAEDAFAAEIQNGTTDADLELAREVAAMTMQDFAARRADLGIPNNHTLSHLGGTR